MTDLSTRARAIVEAGRHADDPTSADRARVHRALAQALVTGAVATAAGTAAGKGLLGGTLWLKTVAIVAALAGAGTATVAYVAVARRPRAPASVVNTTRTVPAQPPAPRDLAPAPAVAPALPATPQPAVSRGASRQGAGHDRRRGSALPADLAGSNATTDGLTAEIRDLREVQRALQAAAPDRALALLDEQAQRHRGGQLNEERAAARILALCQMGRFAEGRAAITALMRDFPRSPLIARVRAACAASQSPFSHTERHEPGH